MLHSHKCTCFHFKIFSIYMHIHNVLINMLQVTDTYLRKLLIQILKLHCPKKKILKSASYVLELHNVVSNFRTKLVHDILSVTYNKSENVSILTFKKWIRSVRCAAAVFTIVKAPFGKLATKRAKFTNNRPDKAKLLLPSLTVIQRKYCPIVHTQVEIQYFSVKKNI